MPDRPRCHDPESRSFAAVIAYDGTDYHGWQRQRTGALPEPPTVQLRLTEAISQLAGVPTSVLGSGRTDSGVHALGQVVSFAAEMHYPIDEIHRAINARLPRDIRVVRMGEVSSSFHPRFDAAEKTYFYQVDRSSSLSPFDRRYRLLEKRPLDISAMRDAAATFVGSRDFRALATRCRSREDTVRTIFSIRLVERPRLLRVFVTGDGFLYRMVRGIIGMLLAVGRGELAPDSAIELVERGDRSFLPATAPPEGLFLWRVCYKASRFCSKNGSRISRADPSQESEFKKPFFLSIKRLERITADPDSRS